jgi:hypothetical protein
VQPDLTRLLMPRQQIQITVLVDVGEQRLPRWAADVERRDLSRRQHGRLSAALTSPR